MSKKAMYKKWKHKHEIGNYLKYYFVKFTTKLKHKHREEA